MTPTQRTLKRMRDNGRTCAIVEKWNMHARIRQDMFGWCDIVALDQQRGIVGVQCCAGASFAARRAKILGECRELASKWLQCGGRIELWAWRKVGERGKRKLWSPRVEEITLADVEC